MSDAASRTAPTEPDAAPARPARRDEILVAAGLLFREKGYHATSMRDLARALDLQGSSLYSHFAAKEDVLWEIVSRAAAAFRSASDSVPSDLPPDEKLAALIRAHLGVVAAELATATVFFQDWLHLGANRRLAMVAVRDAYQQRFVDVIAAGRAAGLFRTDDTRMAALIVMSALNWSYQWLDPDGRMSLEAVAEAYTKQLIAGLKAESAESPLVATARGATHDRASAR